jgi:2,5-diketo-D-gluconate reductase A
LQLVPGALRDERRKRGDEVNSIEIAAGIRMPQLGLGVWQMTDQEAAASIRTALDSGYRSIDTAAIYRNERGTGQGIGESRINRQDIFVTTKLWNDRHDDAPAALQESLKQLGLGYVDLYLIHWPAPQAGRFVEAWRELVALREAGLARAIGVSNFQIPHLRRIVEATGVVPAVNQIELHPWLQQSELRQFHQDHGITTEAWSPIGRGALLDDPVVQQLAMQFGRSSAQIVLRWHIQLGNVVIPKSVTASRIRENIAVFDFELDQAAMTQLAGLNRDQRLGPDPDRFG